MVVGSGPNGLAAALTLAQGGLRPLVYEGAEQPGGGTRTEELTLPGFRHDICSCVHPMGIASPYFRHLPLAQHGLEWVQPDVPLAHPFDDGTAAVLRRDTRETGDSLDSADREAWGELLDPFVERWPDLFDDALAPLHFPSHPLLLARFGLSGLRSATGLAASRFEGPRARALFLGTAAHVLDPLDSSPTAAFGLMLAVAGHGLGWPFARGGSQAVADALVEELRRLGGTVITGSAVRSLEELPAAAATVLDLTPRQVLAVAGGALPRRYRRALERYRYAAGICKVDWALSEPIPWTAPDCRSAGTVHLGGSAEEIIAAADAPAAGRLHERPYVIVAQPTLFDPSRAPSGRHVAWAYCHVPLGSGADMTAAIERQVERFAPGFRDTVLARSTRTALEMEAHNPNLVGGDINGGSQTLAQLFSRPVARIVPYGTPVKGLFLCSAATPPGGGVHGMCGHHAGQAVLRAV